ncbi:MAG: hypothetical protein U9O97_06490 [Elusimicrobiota bacterium]|nr:hypothetical protein [Elusimicrobiota bacterium]
MKIAIFANMGRKKVIKNLANLKKLLKKAGISVSVSNFDTAFVLGGDGWLLKTLREVYLKKVSVYFFPMGENTHNKGFKISDMAGILNGTLKTAEYTPPYLQSSMTAFNDIVIKTGKVARTMKYKVTAGKKTMISEGDGVIVATPIGSGAYNMAAGGKILGIGSRKTAITPLVAFRGDSKGTTIGQKQNITVKILNKQGDVWEIADGCLIKPAATITRIIQKQAVCRIVFPQTKKQEEQK